MKTLAVASFLFIFLSGSMGFAVEEAPHSPCDGIIVGGISAQQQQNSAVSALLGYLHAALGRGIYTPQQIEQWIGKPMPSPLPRVSYNPQSSGLLDAIAENLPFLDSAHWPSVTQATRGFLKAMRENQLHVSRARTDTEALFRWRETEVKTAPETEVPAHLLSSRGEFFYVVQNVQHLMLYQRGKLEPLKTLPHSVDDERVVLFESSKGEILLAIASFFSLKVYDVRSLEVPLQTYDLGKNPVLDKVDYKTKILMLFEQAGEVKVALAPINPSKSWPNHFVFVFTVKPGEVKQEEVTTQRLDIEAEEFVQVSRSQVIAMGVRREADKVRLTFHDVSRNGSVKRAEISIADAPGNFKDKNYSPFAFLDEKDQPQMGIVAGVVGSAYLIDWNAKMPVPLGRILETSSWYFGFHRGKDNKPWFATLERSSLDEPVLVYGNPAVGEEPVRIPLEIDPASNFGSVNFVESSSGLQIFFQEYARGIPARLIVVDVLSRGVMYLRLPQEFGADLASGPIYNPVDQTISIFKRNIKKGWALYQIYGRQSL